MAASPCAQGVDDDQAERLLLSKPSAKIELLPLHGPRLISAIQLPHRPWVVPVSLLYSPRYQNVSPPGSTVIPV